MNKNYSLILSVAMLLGSISVLGQTTGFKTDECRLRGIWQMYFYVAHSPETPGELKAGNTFKVLTDDGRITNFTVIPNQGSLVTGYGSYTQTDDNTYVESIEKNIHLPMLDGQENVMLFELKDNDDTLVVRFFIDKDEEGNELNTWYYETWKRVVMPDKFPEDLVR